MLASNIRLTALKSYIVHPYLAPKCKTRKDVTYTDNCATDNNYCYKKFSVHYYVSRKY